jgi:hypothetical protein
MRQNPERGDMPNHISNLLTVDGSRHRVTTLFETIKPSEPDNKDVIDFEKIIPMPPHIFRGSPIMDEDGEITGYGLSAADEEKYGAENCWYQWSRTHWGTKWNAYSSVIRGNGIYFQTAWHAPFPVIAALTAQFPDFTITLQWADEDIGRNAGKIIYGPGGVFSRHDIQGADAARLWFELNPSSEPREYGYEPVTYRYVGEEAAP